MAPRKLSDSDKGDIIELYKQPGQTTSTLAEQYGVSNSTISRILKTTLLPEEYSALISQKRMAGSDKAEAPPKSSQKSSQKSPEKKKSRVPSRQAAPDRDLAAVEDSFRAEPSEIESAGSDLVESGIPADETSDSRPKKVGRPKLKTAADKDEQLALLSDDTGRDDTGHDGTGESVLADDEEDDDDDDDLFSLDETLGDDFGDDDDDELDDDELDDDDDSVNLPKPKRQSSEAMEIMPLTDAVLPKPCYLVIDMRSELITRPLSDFADLGQIPSDEETSKTLPVFDNHRVARRFSRNKQRVIKVPDGSLITRTSPYLQAKGITRLLVDGQVFDLVSK